MALAVATAVDGVVIAVGTATGAFAHTAKAEEAGSFVKYLSAGGSVADEDQCMKRLANGLIEEVD